MRTKRNVTTEISGGRWREPQAREVLQRWRESGLSGSAFARAHGLNPQRLLWWRKRLESADETALAPLTFIPAEVTGAAAAVIVRLPGGVVLEVAHPAAVPARWVAELAAEMKAQS